MGAGPLSRLATLGEPGNLGAEPGSQPWAIAVRLELQARIHKTEFDRGSVGQMARLMEKYAGYRHLFDARGRPFRSYRAFCQEPPPRGLGYDPAVLQRLIDGPATTPEERAQMALPLAEHRRPTKDEQANKDNDVMFIVRQGNDAGYLTARIARDRPDVLERMKAGEFRSVRAAAIAAGLVHRTITVRPSIAGFTRAALTHLGPADVAALITALQSAHAEVTDDVAAVESSAEGDE